ncbi:MAG: hypothetical protein QOJ09_2394 [Actinomycetota bacterium]|nr:hypothetical protein [Actinomycetota bacterium]
MLTELVRQIPLYSHLPQEQLQGEILDILNYNLGVFFRILREGGKPSPADLSEIRASAARRAEERIPLEAVLTAYHVGALVAWEALGQEARPDERDDLLVLAAPVMAYIEAVTSAVAGAYLEERQAIYGEEREARRALAEALLSGGPSDAVAQRGGQPLAPGYLVMALHVKTTSDETDEGVEAAVASRRKLRRMEQALVGGGWRDALSLLGGSGGTVLIPVRGDTAEPEQAGLSDLLVRLRDAAGADVTAGVSFRPGVAGTAVAGAEAAEVLRLAIELERPPGLYVLDDVLLEFLVTRPSDAGTRLAAVLSTLDRGPELLETLQGYFDADLDRRTAAAALNIHPNTLDYRLKRVGELTGLSTNSARGLQVLGAALVARRLSRS